MQTYTLLLTLDDDLGGAAALADTLVHSLRVQGIRAWCDAFAGDWTDAVAIPPDVASVDMHKWVRNAQMRHEEYQASGETPLLKPLRRMKGQSNRKDYK